MPFGFKKPSRSYASSANAYYDPISGYPTPYDPQSRPVKTVTKGYDGYGRDSEVDDSDDGYADGRVRRRDFGVAGNEDRGRRASHDPAQVGKKKSSTVLKASRTSSVPASDSSYTPRARSQATVKKTRQPAHHAETQHASGSQIGSSKMMRSASALGVNANSKQERQKRNQQVVAAMSTFSALDLAPPAPKSKRGAEEEEQAYSDSEEALSEDEERSGDVRPAMVPAPSASTPTNPTANHRIETIEKHVPPQSGYIRDDISDAEAEADSGGDEEPSARGSTMRAGDRTMEEPPPEYGREETLRDSRTSSPSESARPAVRLARYNEYGELTPPTSDHGGRMQTQGNASQAEMTSYDAASPWSGPGSSHAAASSTSQIRSESRASVRSSGGVLDRLLHRNNGDQVSRKYALSPALSPLGSSSEDTQPLSFGTGGELVNGLSNTPRQFEDAHASPYRQERQPVQQREAPSTPMPNASLAPPTFALQPPTPHQDLTTTPFHDVQQSHTETTGTPSHQAFATSESRTDYRLPNGLVLGAAIGSSDGPHSNQSQTPRPVSMTNSRSSSNSTTSATNSDQGFRSRQGQAQSMTSRIPALRSASPTPPQSSAPSSVSDRPPAPPNPNQPAFLKWDPTNQRWIPVPTLANNSLPPPRPESVVSSVSAYSQMSAARAPAAVPTSASQARRQSLPTLALSPTKSMRRAPSPAMSSYSRPASPSMGPMLASPIAGTAFPSRRMSIDPPYLMNPNTLTLLPEMYEAEATPTETPISPRSAPHSRAPSIDGRASASAYGYRSSFSSYRPRDSQAFPAGYDVNARVAEMSRGGSDSRASSVNGDFISEGESKWRNTYGHSRASSLYREDIPYEESEYDAASQVAPSAYGASNAPSVNGVKRKSSVKPGKESALDVMSVRGDSVQLLGSDGTEQPASGYTSLVLPSGAYIPSDPTKSTDRLDHRLLGMPHATMSTITVSDNSVLNGRRSSLGGLIHHRDANPTPAHLLADLPAPVSFSSHQAPPSKISASQVLVQVHAVSLDKFDSDMVREKASSGSGAGKWIPGRSFVGRALDVGADVRVILKGDMVMGLVDIRKSGCLAEYIVVDRRRLARIPLGVNLSLEEVACLPLLGVAAHRACLGQTRGSRALILNAHEGVGALAAQELSSMGLHVIAHVPLDVASAEEDAWDNGAKEVIADDAVAVINAQHESGFEFVLDTIGGRRIYDACRRVIRSNGVFVTLFGDDADHVPSGPQVKSSLHALRRAFVKKDKKAISYVHLLPGGAEIDVSGQDTRDILELPVMSLYRPKVASVLPFEHASEAFEELASLVSGRLREESGAVVVRLSN